LSKGSAYDAAAVAAASRVMPSKSAESRIGANMEALCSPVRVKILRALTAAELSAGDLAIVIERSRSATSQHLRVLREAAIVVGRRVGNIVRYRLSDNVDSEVLAKIALQIDAA
jgi:DNA-binding transcriptional ArsR family regulator